MGSNIQGTTLATSWVRRILRSVSNMTASVLLAFAASLALVGCLPYYYNNRHHHPEYHPNYHYSYVDEPSYSQPTGRWVRVVECIGARTFCTFPVGSRDQATCVEDEEEGDEDAEEAQEKLNDDEEVGDMMSEGTEVELDLEEVLEVVEPGVEGSGGEVEQEENTDDLQQAVEDVVIEIDGEDIEEGDEAEAVEEVTEEEEEKIVEEEEDEEIG